MTGLQEAFYIVGLVYMGISLIIIFGLLVAVLVIRKKVVDLEQMIKDKFDTVTHMGAAAGEVINTVKKITKRKSK